MGIYPTHVAELSAISEPRAGTADTPLRRTFDVPRHAVILRATKAEEDVFPEASPLKKQSRFMMGAVLVAGAVGYLMVTGMRDAMVYYYTPGELTAMVETDPGYSEIGLRMGGEVNPGSVSFDQRTLDLHFHVADAGNADSRVPVHYRGPLPDTFEEGREVVVEGRFTEAGVFEASTVLTKCGSRYDAVEEDLIGTYGGAVER